MKKRILSIVLCLCMALTLLPTAALAAPPDGTLTKLDISKGAITITSDTASSYDSAGTEVKTNDPDGYLIVGTGGEAGNYSTLLTITGQPEGSTIKLGTATEPLSITSSGETPMKLDGATVQVEGNVTITGGGNPALSVTTDAVIDIAANAALTANSVNAYCIESKIGTLTITGSGNLTANSTGSALLSGSVDASAFQGNIELYTASTGAPALGGSSIKLAGKSVKIAKNAAGDALNCGLFSGDYTGTSLNITSGSALSISSTTTSTLIYDRGSTNQASDYTLTSTTGDVTLNSAGQIAAGGALAINAANGKIDITSGSTDAYAIMTKSVSMTAGEEIRVMQENYPYTVISATNPVSLWAPSVTVMGKDGTDQALVSPSLTVSENAAVMLYGTRPYRKTIVTGTENITYEGNGGDVTYDGLDLSNATVKTSSTAGEGTILWEPVMNGDKIASGTLTLTNAKMLDDNNDHTLYLPQCPVTMVVNGENILEAKVKYATQLTVKGDSTEDFLHMSYSFEGNENALTVENCTLEAKINTNNENLQPNLINGVFNGIIRYNATETNSKTDTIYGGISHRALFADIFKEENYKLILAENAVLTLHSKDTLTVNKMDNLTLRSGARIVNDGTIILPTGTTNKQIAALNLSGTGTVQVGGKLYIDGKLYEDGGKVTDTGLDLSAVKVNTIYKAGEGTIVFTPADSTADPATPATLTLHNAYMNRLVSKDVLKLPTAPVVMQVIGENDINTSIENATNLTVTGGQGDRLDTYNISFQDTGETALTVNGCTLDGEILMKSPNTKAPKLQNGGVLNGIVSTQVAESSYVLTVYGSYFGPHDLLWVGESSKLVLTDGAVLTLPNTGGNVYLVVTDLTQLQIAPTAKLINNDVIELPTDTTADQIKGLSLSGSGLVKVGGITYTNDGEIAHVYTTAMDFSSQTENKGILEEDGYAWNAATATLTLKNLYLTANNVSAIMLPAQSNLVLEGINTVVSRGGSSGYGIKTAGRNAEADTLTITGTGSLNVSSSDVKGIWAQGALVIKSGTVNCTGGTYGIRTDGSLTIEGGTVNAQGENGISAGPTLAVKGGTVTATGSGSGSGSDGLSASNVLLSGGTLTATGDNNGMDVVHLEITGGRVYLKGGQSAVSATSIDLSGVSILSPSGAEVGPNGDGQSILLNGQMVKEATIGKAPSSGGSSKPSNSTTKGDTVTVTGSSGTVSNSAISSAISNAGEDSTVHINASGATTITLSGAAVTEVTENGSSLNITVKGDGQVTVQPEILEALDLKATDKVSVGITTVKSTDPNAIAFEVSLTVNDKAVHELDGNMELSFPMDAAWNDKPVILEHQHADGSVTFSEAVVKDGKVSVTVTDLSTFTVRLAADMPAAALTDVVPEAYYYGAVNWAVEKGITGGRTATAFAPNDLCIRAQAVTFLWRAMGSPEPTTTVNPFTDVSADAYYNKAVLWAVEQGITGGTSATTFAPNAVCSRSQVVTFLWRLEGSPVVNFAMNFVDVNADSYYAEAVRWAVSEAITGGTSATTFSPANACTRGQIVTFLYRALGK